MHYGLCKLQVYACSVVHVVAFWLCVVRESTMNERNRKHCVSTHWIDHTGTLKLHMLRIWIFSRMIFHSRFALALLFPASVFHPFSPRSRIHSFAWYSTIRTHRHSVLPLYHSNIFAMPKPNMHSSDTNSSDTIGTCYKGEIIELKIDLFEDATNIGRKFVARLCCCCEISRMWKPISATISLRVWQMVQVAPVEEQMTSYPSVMRIYIDTKKTVFVANRSK